MKRKKLNNLVLGAAALLLSIGFATTCAGGLVNEYRATIDGVFGTSSYITNAEDVKYESSYSTGEELMIAAKDVAVRQGAEGTVIMKNDNGVLPLKNTAPVAVFGGASYSPYMSASFNEDQIILTQALKDAGFKLDATVDAIYADIFSKYTESVHPWTGEITRNYIHSPNKAAGDYTDFKIYEVNPNRFVSEGFESQGWEEKVDAEVGIVTFSRPGGEGTTYKPGSALDVDGKPTGKNPLALSADELAVVKAAKATCKKVVVLLNTSCTIEVGPLTEGEYEVDGIAYVGIPNDYQFKGVVQALDGTVNPTGALADTYATSSTSSPAMENFGLGHYSDYKDVAKFNDSRWPGQTITNEAAGSFGGSATYNGGTYLNQLEGIYTGYNYYETRYYDAIANPSYNAKSEVGSTNVGNWDYAKEVDYTFGHGLSYLDYSEELLSVKVEDRVSGNITASVAITNKSDKDGKFRAELFVQSPYTDYDRKNLVEKSAIQFLNSAKVDVEAGKTKVVEISIPTKYMASYDYTNAKTYIMDAGTYYFSTGNGAHEALNNIMTAQNLTPDNKGDLKAVKTWINAGETDTTTYAVSEAGEKITNVADNADLNYYAPGSSTHLTRSDWKGTWPVDFTKEENTVAIADSPKKDEWLKELRNQQYVIKDTDNVANVDGVKGPKFSATEIGYDQITSVDDPYWDKLADAIPAEEALGAIAHGGSQSDTLSNIENPVVTQNDGPNGFNGKRLSAGNGESAEVDKYFVDPDSEAGKFKAAVNSQTLLGSSFNPELARDWGKILGNTGLWIKQYQIWGGGLNYHRTPYNGRNTEYLSEDPMLTNVLGRELIVGSNEFGLLNAPKHIGFNDQEHNRSGISVYMNEQKFRETDLRGFQGAIEDARSMGVMVAFNRIGAINASHHVGMLQNLLRKEWNFDGLISTDMMNNKYYFNPEGCALAGVTQMADFAGNNSHLNMGNGGVDATWGYLSPETVKHDQKLVDLSREAMKYQLYAFANTAILNISTKFVTPSWELALNAINITSYSLGAVALASWGVLIALQMKKEND